MVRQKEKDVVDVGCGVHVKCFLLSDSRQSIEYSLIYMFYVGLICNSTFYRNENISKTSNIQNWV